MTDAERDRLLAVRIEELRAKVQGCAGNAAVSVAAVEPFRAASEALDLIAELSAEIERLRASVIEECAKVCEAQDATVNVYNNPLNGMKHPVAEQSYRRCAAAIRSLKEREAQR